MAEPTKKQLRYLHDLGYTGTPPGTSGEASKLIDHIEGGMTPAAAEKSFLKYRKQRDERDLELTKTYLEGLHEMNEGYPTCAGFRLKVNASEAAAETQTYHRAFLPLDLATKFPRLLMLDGLEYDELVNVPGNGKFVVSPGKVVERAKGKPVPSAGGCGAVLLFAIVSIIAATVCAATR